MARAARLAPAQSSEAASTVRFGSWLMTDITMLTMITHRTTMAATVLTMTTIIMTSASVMTTITAIPMPLVFYDCRMDDGVTPHQTTLP